MKEIPTDQHITYQWQYRKCGRTLCKQCHPGKGHGPYVYAEWYAQGKRERQRTAYVGKNLPAGVHQQKRKRER